MTQSIEQLKRHEGIRLFPYKCTADKLTIGIGRNLQDVGISEQEAETMLLNDIEIAKEQLIRKFPWTEELDEVRDEVSTLQGTLHKLKQEKHEAEADALAAKERTNTLRSGFFAEINKEVAVATTQVERKAEEMEELNKKELRVKSQLDVLQKEIKKKKKEMNSLTYEAEDTMRAAKAEKAKTAEKAPTPPATDTAAAPPPPPSEGGEGGKAVAAAADGKAEVEPDIR